MKEKDLRDRTTKSNAQLFIDFYLERNTNIKDFEGKIIGELCI